MIKNLCSIIEFYCGNGHENPIPFDVKDGSSRGMDSFYACPKYYDYNRHEGEKACNNNLSFRDYYSFVTKLDKILTEAEMNGQKVNLTNMVIKMGKVEYTIFEHSDKKIRVSVINKKVIMK